MRDFRWIRDLTPAEAKAALNALDRQEPPGHGEGDIGNPRGATGEDTAAQKTNGPAFALTRSFASLKLCSCEPVALDDSSECGSL